MAKLKKIIPPANMERSDVPFSTEQRYELKLSSEGGTPALGRSWIKMHPEGFQVAHPPRVVNNLYLDTIDLQSFNDNLSGISDRLKLRLRWYGRLENYMVINPILEMKIKKNMIGDKRREVLETSLDLNRSYRSLLDKIISSASPRWLSLLQSAIQPTIINRYEREYYVSPDGVVRITLDHTQVTYNQRFGSRPNLNRPLPAKDFLLLEIKSTPEHRERLEQAMGFFPIQRTRNSKYVNGLLGGPG